MYSSTLLVREARENHAHGVLPQPDKLCYLDDRADINSQRKRHTYPKACMIIFRNGLMSERCLEKMIPGYMKNRKLDFGTVMVIIIMESPPPFHDVRTNKA
jgi:hypothetical protein